MMKIEANLPFEFCAECMNRELQEDRLYGPFGDVAEMFTTCAKERICKNAVKLYMEKAENREETKDA